MVEAALANRCELFIGQSITLLYGDRRGEPADERADIATPPLSMLRSAVDMERTIREAAEGGRLPATILRFGTFYSYDSASTRQMFGLIRKGQFPVIGSGDAYWNMINVDDAAAAVAQAVEHRRNASFQVINVCDDEPVRARDLLDYLARTLRAWKPLRVPRLMADLVIGRDSAVALTASVRCRNQLTKDTLGWRPQYPSYRDGYGPEIAKWLQMRRGSRIR